MRELLSVHNIGQRLFAKYVLGLSQGTVSELLSKPKSWDKLTEKGRDSYRKMHAWVWDDQAILLLKTLIPRKGELLRSSNSLMKSGKLALSLSPWQVSHVPRAAPPDPEREERHHHHHHHHQQQQQQHSEQNMIENFLFIICALISVFNNTEQTRHHIYIAKSCTHTY